MKGYIRRGICLFHIGEYDGAKKDIKQFIKLSENDIKQKKIGNEWLNKIINKQKMEYEKQKEIYGNFLNKKNEKGKNINLYDDKEDINNDKGWIKLIVDGIKDIFIVIPEAFISVFNECTQLCRKKKITNKQKQL